MSNVISSLMGLGIAAEAAKSLSNAFVDNTEERRAINVAAGLGEYLPYNTTSTTLDSTFRIRCTIAQDCAELRLWYANAKQAAGLETPAANAITIAASIQFADANGAPTGSPIPARFLGAPTYSLGASGVICTDPIGVALSAGTEIYILTHVAVTSAEYGRNRFVIPSQAFSGEGTGAGNQTVTVSSILSGSSGANGYAPFAITGAVRSVPKKSLVVVGDSNTTQYYDQGLTSSVTTVRGGWIVRAFSGTSGVTHLGLGGDKLSTWAANGAPQRGGALSLANAALIAMGTNDLGSKTLAEMQSDYELMVDVLRRYGITSVHAATILPRTTSTDLWTTVANQTTASTEATRQALNDWLLSERGRLFDQVLDVASVVTDSQGRWKASATIANSGTFTTGSTSSTLNPASALSANNAYIGRVLRVTSGAVSGSAAVIQYHTTTQIQLLYGLSGSPASTDAYEVLDTYTVDGIHMTTKAVEVVAASINAAGLFA